VLSFLLFMGVFTAIGLASVRVKQDTTDDYLIAGRGMHPGLAALSAVSTWNSGYMFIGAIGYTYLMGYSIIWLSIASFVGQFIAWIWLYKFIQEEAKGRDVRSLTSLVSNVSGAPEAKLAALLSVIFLSVYAAAQLTSGGKALLVMMGWSELVGILIGFVLVVAYCYAGGIRASIWTDAAQSCTMIVGSLVLCWVALSEVGGLSGLHGALAAQDRSLTSLYPPDLKFGLSLWMLGFLLGGLSVAGQPQVVSRVMTLGTDADRKKAMIWFFVWQTPFYLLIALIGLASRVIFPEANFDPELGLPMLAMDLLPPFLVGLILASIFAATMSTADSQVLACTAAVTDDLRPEWSQDHKKTKRVTLAIAVFATLISIGGQYIPGGNNVFGLVILAVYGLGSIFIPILIIRWMGYEPDTQHAVTMMLAAITGVILWRLMGWNMDVFESVPGMAAAFGAHFISNKIRSPETSSLGRYKLPDSRKIAAIAAAIIIPVGAVEASYFLTSSESSDVIGGVGTYSVAGIYSYHQIAEGSEYVEDQGIVSIIANSDAAADQIDGNNIVGVRATLTHTDDETQQGLGCASPTTDEPQDDYVLANLSHGVFSHDGMGLSDFLVDVTWHNGDIINTTVSNMSKSEIQMMLDGESTGIGEHALDLEVNVETGGGLGCQTTDDGEEVAYTIELISLEYTIETVS